jgi:lipoic acid synthetase
VRHGRPLTVDADEPRRVAEAVARLGLRHVVVTSVNRDDLPDGGAGHFAATARLIKALVPESRVEVLIPDFQGDANAERTVVESQHRVGASLVQTRTSRSTVRTITRHSRGRTPGSRFLPHEGRADARPRRDEGRDHTGFQ